MLTNNWKRLRFTLDLQVARGVDLARVNLVANLDLPRDGATYMHRVGRTGRYGTRGIAVTFANSTELARLREDLQDIAGGQVLIETEWGNCVWRAGKSRGKMGVRGFHFWSF